MLAIELFTAECFFQASKKANSETIALYFADLARLLQAKGFEKLDVFLDQNSTHKNKMQGLFKDLTAELTIKVRFHFIAAYSPKLNLVEYAIHLIRQKVLHHADCKKSLKDFEKYIESLCENQKIMTKQNIINVLCHIEELVSNL